LNVKKLKCNLTSHLEVLLCSQDWLFVSCLYIIIFRIDVPKLECFMCLLCIPNSKLLSIIPNPRFL
jgi:hypothetical protein